MIDGIDIGDKAWSDVLQAMDRTYAELVDYQEELEARNSELTNLRYFLTSIMRSISDYLIVTDRDGHIADASQSFRQAVDSGLEALTGQAICSFFQGTDCDNIRAAMAKTLAMRQDSTLSVELITKTGRDPVEFRISPRLDRRGKSTGVILTGRPMGELKQAYSELETSHKELQETQTQLVRNEKMASLGRLLAGVAHELNNPISFVYANTHTLEKYLSRFETYFEQVQAGASRADLIALRQELKLDRQLDNLRSAVQGACDGAERVRDIVEDLRRLSADGTGDITHFDLAETARVAANWVKRGTKSDLIVRFSGEDCCIVRGRPGHMQQVLMNLVQNAVDAMAGGARPEICFDLSYEGNLALMRVSDTGPGIPPDMAQTVFDPFFTTKAVGQGTGLGLSISYKIVEEHGGRLELLEQAGPGACFQISLPRGDQV